MKRSKLNKGIRFAQMPGLLAAGLSVLSAFAAPPTSVDLSKYILVGRHSLPHPSQIINPPDSTLAQEASSITYNWDSDTLFVIGDGGTTITQVSKTGQLLNFMTLGPGFLDTEGINYVGEGHFVLVEERERRVSLFTYTPGSTLQKANALTVKLGTTIGNIGLEGVGYDPVTGGLILVKEKDPISVFQTFVDFAAGTASNGSATTTSSIDLFNPTLANVVDFSDVFALANLPSLVGQPDESHLLIISQESGQILNIDRSGVVHSKMTITAPAGSSLSVLDMTMEGVTMDRDGFLYVCNENGGGDPNHPELWVYAPSDAPNTAPTALALINPVTSIPANTSVALPVKLAQIAVTDDGLGNNNLTLTGADAASFQIIGTALFLKAGPPLNPAVKASYSVTVNVDDSAVGASPDASADYTLHITPAEGGTPSLIISEVAPWSSGNSLPILRVDWIEISNIGTAAQDITGWKIDDDSNAFNSGVALSGITSIAPGESVVFLETANNLAQTIADKKAAFISVWFGGTAPANFKIGTYSGGGIGLGTGGDAMNLYNSAGVLQTRVTFGQSPNGPVFSTFDNAAGLNNTAISTLSAVGINGAFAAATDPNEIGSPGTIGAAAAPTVSIVALDANAAELGSDSGTFRIARTGSVAGSLTVNYTVSTGAGQATASDLASALTGVALIPSGSSFVDVVVTPVDDAVLEGNETVTLTLFDTGNYDVGAQATATVAIADHLIAPELQAGISVTRGAFVMDRKTGLFVQGNSLLNATASPIPGPIYLVLDNVSPNATLSGAAGVTTSVAPLGSRYVVVIGAGSSLAPGASAAAVLNFVNPSRAAITYSTRVLSGGNTAP